MTYHVKVIAGGKIVIPADLRRQSGIRDGDTLIVEHHPDGALSVKTHVQIVREVQAEIASVSRPYTGSAVDDLLAERRAEAAAEDREVAGAGDQAAA